MCMHIHIYIYIIYNPETCRKQGRDRATRDPLPSACEMLE